MPRIEDDPLQKMKALSEMFWIASILVYESICFLIFSLLAVLSSPNIASIFHRLPFVLDVHGPVLQTICATLGILVFTFFFELLESFVIRPFINRLKNRSSRVLRNVPGILSCVLAIFFSYDILKQFYHRFDLLMLLPSPTPHTPITSIGNTGYHILMILKQCPGLSYYKSLHSPLDPDVVLESKNTAKFILGILYLTYFIYKHALKRVPIMAIFTFTDHTMVHFISDGFLAILVILSVGIFDLWNVKTVSRDLFIYCLVVAIVMIAYTTPWNRIYGMEENHDPDQQMLIFFSYWVHAVFYFISIYLMCYIFFKVELAGKDSVVYFYEREKPVVKNDDFGFAIPSRMAARNELRRIAYTVNMSITAFRLLHAIMLTSMTRCVFGSLNL